MKGIAPLRERKGLTQEQLAQQLDVRRSTLAMWEAGKSWPSSEILPDLADILGATIDELYGTPAPAKTP